jgi:hypothetical protein
MFRIRNREDHFRLAAGAASPFGLKGLVDNSPPLYGYPQVRDKVALLRKPWRLKALLPTTTPSFRGSSFCVDKDAVP